MTTRFAQRCSPRCERQRRRLSSAGFAWILANVVKEDQVTMWCQVQGTDTYDDAMGGKITVPTFSVYIIKDNGSLNSDQNTATDTPTGSPGE